MNLSSMVVWVHQDGSPVSNFAGSDLEVEDVEVWDLLRELNKSSYCQWWFLVPIKGGSIFHPPEGNISVVYKWYILPIGGYMPYATYHLLREPKTTIDIGSGQIIVTSQGSLGPQKVAFWKGPISLFQGNPGWWNIQFGQIGWIGLGKDLITGLCLVTSKWAIDDHSSYWMTSK